ncbi:MAG: hypothetical protein P4L81_02565 [Candidatus Pacebacteria bacterium]|nr:hypothetical protein [Candidatus Paceibacterota bacterium]
MSEEMQIEGKPYISSKRAAELSGYAQDYIGQLARKTLIDARRIGGLWYVSMDSLEDYKKKAEEYKPQPPAPVASSEPSTLIFFDGKEYLSAARAAEQTGYTQDYVGQLARSGSVLSRQVGNRWYVERESIISHKQEKDSLLAAVQKEAVGLAKPHAAEFKIDSSTPQEPLLHYFAESADLLPSVAEQDSSSEEGKSEISSTRDSYLHDEPAQIVPIKRLEPIKRPSTAIIRRPSTLPLVRTEHQINRLPLLIGAVATIVIVISVGYVSVLKQNSVYATNTKENSSANSLTASVANAFAKIGDILEPYLTHDLTYQRPGSN